MLFRSVPKPTMSLLQRLTADSTFSDAPSAPTDDSVYKFDFLQDVADIDYSSLPLVGDTASTSVKPPMLESNLKTPSHERVTADQPAATLPEHILSDALNPVLNSLPRVPSFRAHKRNLARTNDDNSTDLSDSPTVEI